MSTGKRSATGRTPRRSTRRARTATLAAAALGGVVVAGCADGGAQSPAGPASGTFSPPPFVAASRAIETGRLSVTLTVGRDDVPLARNGEVWTGTFRLPEDSAQTFPVEVLWSYAATGRSEPIPIASASDTVSLADDRQLRVSASDYATDAFDFDLDGIDNFAEIDRGSDPLFAGGGVDAPLEGGVARAPNEDQDDCRDTVLPGERAVDVGAERDVFRLAASPIDDTVAVEFDVEQLVYHATLSVESAGIVTIEHVSGQPTNTNALLYDRLDGAEGFEGSAGLLVTANATTVPDGIPARVSARLARPGLYCYALFDELGADFGEGAVLADIVLRVQFTPEA